LKKTKVRIFRFAPLPLCILRLEQCSRRTSDNQGEEGVVSAGLEERGQKLSKQDVKMAKRVSVGLLVSHEGLLATHEGTETL